MLVAAHGLPLRSAYEAVTGSEPLFTTCHDAYVGTVDYIWYTADAEAEAGVAPAWRIRPRGVHLPPALRTLQSGLPCQTWPSDHIALVADFDLWRGGTGGEGGK
ncbi:hypothetical protein H632_c4322p1 [Helicosporidium sp. ATCC 50920]|nr:hypothetical protein H632_c4322p1 [Helicosporidium sp. ATCC 50920]|eukprot:KDD71833.1 hypothetical protein H632_c4322p1 [Helicosporidium sp. ATCC 50920]